MSVAPSYESIEELIKEQNPFQYSLIIHTDQVWSDKTLDMEELNQSEFKEIKSAIDLIGSSQELAGGDSKTLGCVLVGPKGWGKTHLLGRTRKFVRTKKKGIFIYSCDYGDLNNIRYQFLQNLVSSLRRKDGNGIAQCQELATYLLSRALRKNYEPSRLINEIDKFMMTKPRLLEKPIEKVVEIFSDISNPDIIKALIWCLSKKYASYALKWLSGQELSAKEAQFMNLPANSGGVQGQLAFQTSLDLLKIIGHYTVPVICFDQLDGVEIVDGVETGSPEVHEMSGYNRSIIVTGLVCDLINNLSKGLVITAMYDETYQEIKDSDVHAQKFQLDRFAQKRFQLQPLTGQQAINLLSARLDEFYSIHGFTAPQPAYPFTSEQLNKIKSQRFPVREVFKWASENWPKHQVPVSPSAVLQKTYEEYEAQLDGFMDNNDLIAQALMFGFRHLIRINQVIEEVQVQEVDSRVAGDKINFRIIGIENGKIVKIGVAIVQHSHSNSVNARVNHLSNYGKYDLTRGCMVRSKTISPTAHSLRNNIDHLCKNLGGEWVSFKPDQLKPILVLYQISKNLNSDIISRSDFHEFMDEFYPLQENYILKEILSDPSGQTPDDLVDEDDEFQKLHDSFQDADPAGKSKEGTELLSDLEGD